jgi:hypothetical protein
MDSRWNKNNPSLSSPEIPLLRRPNSTKQVVAEELIGPRVSKATGKKE